MNNVTLKAALIASLIALTTACVVDTGDTTTDVPRIALNGLTPTALNSSTLYPTVLNGTNLANMAQNANNRTLLQYAVYCALPAGVSVTATTFQGSWTYTGYMAQASTWTSSALTQTQQKWVSACILSLTNLTGMNIMLSLRGNTSLAPTTGEATDYQIQEGAFWGNVFTSTKVMYACNGVQQIANDTYGDLPNRECAEDGRCGFTNMGACTTACTGSTNGEYSGCSGANEVATTYLYGLPQ